MSITQPIRDHSRDACRRGHAGLHQGQEGSSHSRRRFDSPPPEFPRPPAVPARWCTSSRPADAPDSAKLLLEHGWGFVGRNSNDVQADNGAGLNRGIIGLVNKGQPRSLDDWGVLRAWAWGIASCSTISRPIPMSTGKRSALWGVRAVGRRRWWRRSMIRASLSASFPFRCRGRRSLSAELRRNHGQYSGATEFHWFAGNFMKYAAAGDSADEMPVDSHEFIAMVAPRPILHRRRSVAHRSGLCARRRLAGRARYVHGGSRRQSGLESTGRQRPGHAFFRRWALSSTRVTSPSASISTARTGAKLALFHRICR